MDQFPVIAALATMFALLIFSVPIVVAIGMGVIVSLFLGDLPYQLLLNKMFEALNSFPLLAVPFFILAGEIMQRGTMSNSLLKLSRTLVGHKPGGMAHVSVLTCLFYGALCGSAPATVAAVGGIMIPAMSKDCYPLSFSTALNTTAGCLGVLIPPSVPLIIYGCQANVSISDLFIAGIIPGLFIGGVLMLSNILVCKYKGWGVCAMKATKKEIWEAFKEAKYAISVPFIVLGGIYGGIFTPTEAGATAVLYALVIETFVSKSMNLKVFWDVFKATTIGSCAIFIIVSLAVALGQLFIVYNTADVIMELLGGAAQNKYLLLTFVIVVFLIFGCFLDMISNIVLMVPLFMPLLMKVGVDPIHFGIITIVALAIGFMTPPVGVNLFVAVSISGMRIDQLSLAILPYVLLMTVCLFILAFCPALSLALL